MGEDLKRMKEKYFKKYLVGFLGEAAGEVRGSEKFQDFLKNLRSYIDKYYKPILDSFKGKDTLDAAYNLSGITYQLSKPVLVNKVETKIEKVMAVFNKYSGKEIPDREVEKLEGILKK